MEDTIVQVGDPVLREKAKHVLKKEFGSHALKAVIKHMNTALDAEKYGVAIAAPQIGVSKRIFVVSGHAFDTEKKDAGKIEADAPVSEDKAFINPEISRLSRKKKSMSEGCLSVRGKYGHVVRHEKATVRAYDENGKPFVHHGSGLVAHIFQHEVDHLDGILYIDKAEGVEDEKIEEGDTDKKGNE